MAVFKTRRAVGGGGEDDPRHEAAPFSAMKLDSDEHCIAVHTSTASEF